MYFKQFLDERCGCASYLIASRQTHEAAIVDPAIAHRAIRRRSSRSATSASAM